MSEIRTDSLVNQSGDNDSGIELTTNDVVAVKTADTERCRWDASGNLLVGKTADDNTDGVILRADGEGYFVKNNGSALSVNRLSTDGVLQYFFKDTSLVGSIGCGSVNRLIINGDTNGIAFERAGTEELRIGDNHINPSDDNDCDLGLSFRRFDDVYATNGTIQTSDANEKQQIASLTSAEITAAKAISKLFKTFKWNDKVEAKGDAARTHTGVIAQDVEAAMTAAGLDAGDYAFFISSDWYVDADGNEVEADAEGAIAKNRKGIRYPELLSFVGAATEQRLADIETRLTALENA